MSARSTRLEIVLRALQQAGRGVEIRTLVEDLLEDILRDQALNFKWPDLRTYGTGFTLAQGSATTALPSDFGAGIDNLLFGPEKTPLDEKTGDEFVYLRGRETDLTNNSRPFFYTIDRQAGVFRFNRSADQGYSFEPIYFRVPPAMTSDNDNPWFSNDMVLVQLLVAQIYQYTGDEREFTQFQKADRLLKDYKRGVIPLSGGSTRINLARDVFRPKGLRNRTRVR